MELISATILPSVPPTPTTPDSPGIMLNEFRQTALKLFNSCKLLETSGDDTDSVTRAGSLLAVLLQTKTIENRSEHNIRLFCLETVVQSHLLSTCEPQHQAIHLGNLRDSFLRMNRVDPQSFVLSFYTSDCLCWYDRMSQIVELACTWH